MTLLTYDNKMFMVEEAVAMKSKLIEKLWKDRDCTASSYMIRMPEDVNGDTLSLILEWCKKHTVDELTKKQKKIWDAQFIEEIDRRHVFVRVFNAAKDLKIQELVDQLSWEFVLV